MSVSVFKLYDENARLEGAHLCLMNECECVEVIREKHTP